MWEAAFRHFLKLLAYWHAIWRRVCSGATVVAKLRVRLAGWPSWADLLHDTHTLTHIADLIIHVIWKTNTIHTHTQTPTYANEAKSVCMLNTGQVQANWSRIVSCWCYVGWLRVVSSLVYLWLKMLGDAYWSLQPITTTQAQMRRMGHHKNVLKCDPHHPTANSPPPSLIFIPW